MTHAEPSPSTRDQDNLRPLKRFHALTFVVAALLCAGSHARAATILANLIDSRGNPSTQPIRFEPKDNPAISGTTNIVIATTQSVTPTNGLFSIVLVAGNYTVKSGGVTFPKPVGVPLGAGTYLLSELAPGITTYTSGGGTGGTDALTVATDDTDALAGFLFDELEAGTGIELDVTSASGNRRVRINATGSGTGDLSAADLNTSAKVEAIVADHNGTGPLIFQTALDTAIDTVADDAADDLAAAITAINSSISTSSNNVISAVNTSISSSSNNVVSSVNTSFTSLSNNVASSLTSGLATKQGAHNNLSALSSISGNGLYAVTGTGPSSGAARILTLGDCLSGSNLDGVSGNPTFGMSLGTTWTNVFDPADFQKDPSTGKLQHKDGAFYSVSYITNLQSMAFTELASDPGSPEAGKILYYFKDDHKAYKKQSDGTVTEIGAGGGGGGSTTDSASVQVQSGQPSSSNGARIDASGKRFSVLFDPSTAQSITYAYRLPSDYVSGLIVYLDYAQATGTSGAVVWSVEIMDPGTAADDETDSYATANTATDTVAGTAGFEKRVTITATNDDSAAAGHLIFIKISRSAAAGGDTATGVSKLRGIGLEWTKS